jgi:hypothetical protein
LRSQCLDRRIDSHERLVSEIAAWERHLGQRNSLAHFARRARSFISQAAESVEL